MGGSQGAEIFGKVIPQVILDINKSYRINVIQQSLPKQVNEIQNFYNKNNIENYIFSFHENIIRIYKKLTTKTHKIFIYSTQNKIRKNITKIMKFIPDEKTITSQEENSRTD